VMFTFRRSSGCRAPVDAGPYNPTNGHSFLCECVACIMFWQYTAAGVALYEWWRVQNRRR